MPVHVDQVVSDVTTEAEPAAQASGENTQWEEIDRLRHIKARIEQDRLRTAAEGFHD